MYINQQAAQNSCDYTFSLNALHVSHCISPSSGATFISCISHFVYADTIRLAIATQQPDVSAYTKCDIQLIKVAPEDGLIQSETCTVFNEKESLITRILCFLLVYIHIVR